MHKTMTRNATQLKPLPGFPRQEAICTGEELLAYFGEDKLTCLLCGRLYTQLALHIVNGHGIPTDDYKAQFGIPWSYGLAGKSFREKIARQSARLMREGKIPLASRESIEKMLEARKTRRPFNAVVRERTRQRVLAINGRTKIMGPEVFEEYLRRIASGRTPNEVARDEDMPVRPWFSKYVRENPDYRQRYIEIWNNLPYAIQIRSRRLGEKFQKDVVALRQQGMRWKEIGARLDVSAGAARNSWYKLKKQGQQEP